VATGFSAPSHAWRKTIAVRHADYACREDNLMAITIQWSDEYSVHGSLDSEHRRLFALANDVFQIDEPNLQFPKLKNTINALYEYIKFHFGNEERLMNKIGYPEYDRQVAMHKAIIAKMNELMITSRNLEELHAGLQHLMIDWLLAHIRREDRKIGEFIRNSEVSPDNAAELAATTACD
jgi:hemerythrin